MIMLLLSVLLIACGDPTEGAEQCSETQCPVGTAPVTSAEIVESIDLDAEFDPTTYSGELAFKRVGEGSCELTCQTIEACDEGTFPVITEDCYTCGVVSAETGEVAQGACE